MLQRMTVNVGRALPQNAALLQAAMRSTARAPRRSDTVSSTGPRRSDIVRSTAQPLLVHPATHGPLMFPICNNALSGSPASKPAEGLQPVHRALPACCTLHPRMPSSPRPGLQHRTAAQTPRPRAAYAAGPAVQAASRTRRRTAPASSMRHTAASWMSRLRRTGRACCWAKDKCERRRRAADAA